MQNNYLNKVYPELRLLTGVIFCTNGELSLEYDKKYIVTKGEIFLFSPLLNPIVIQNKNFEFITIHLNTSHYFNELVSRIRKTNYRKFPVPLHAKITDEEQIQIIELKNKITELENFSIKENNIVRKNLINALIYTYSKEFLLSLYLNYFKYNDKEDNNVVLTEKFCIPLNFISDIQSNLIRKVEFYAEKSNQSISQFSKSMTNFFGVSPSKLINIILLNNAKHKLQQKETNIKTIAHELKFPDQYTFQKFFKRNTGFTPAEFSRTNNEDS